MCTALTYKTKDHYFGRNLDVDCAYGESIIITPRNYVIDFRNEETIKTHYAIIGMGIKMNNFPLYFDAVNEEGLAMAGLRFNYNIHFKEKENNKSNICLFEFILWILSQCKNIKEVKEILARTNIISEDFCENLPTEPLHWMISDKDYSITVECVKDGMKVYDNDMGVLTNNPTFDIQMFNLNNFMNLSNEDPLNNFSDKNNLEVYCKGMGAIGLPGDYSSMSRFVKTAFLKENSVSNDTEQESTGQFFHILDAVTPLRGCVKSNSGKYEITYYSSCMNQDKGIYYYITYDNRQITGVDMKKENLDEKELIIYSLIQNQQIKIIN